MMRTKTIKSAKTVDDYIKGFPQDVRKSLQDLRRAIKEAAPEAEERISYRIPSYKYHGWLVFFAAHENHSSFIVVDQSIMKTFRREIKSYETAGTTIHFTPAHPLPTTLIKNIVKARMKRNALRTKRGRKRGP